MSVADDLSPSKAEKFVTLQNEAKDLAYRGKLSEALEALKKANYIHSTAKIRARMEKLKAAIKEYAEQEEEEDGYDMVEVTKDFYLYKDVYEKLFMYQRDGVKWMYKLYKRGKGGILGDDMGLGKTFQVIGFLSGMVDADLLKHVLVIMPVSLLPNWKNEFKKWCPGIMVYEFHGSSKKERECNLDRVQRRGGVLLTSYGMVPGNLDMLSTNTGRSFVWDYVILDEGHKIKNPNKTTKAIHEIPARNRLVLTGTPIQNNLRELWALFDFVHHGTLLGSIKTFKMQYENPITRSREKDATSGEKRLGHEMSQNLKKLIDPYFLRRTKDVLDKAEGNSGDNNVASLSQEMEKMSILSIARKNDFIIWLFMSETQYQIYTSFLQSDTVKRILMTKRSPLVELTTLKKICDHPRLLSQKACLQLGLNGEISEEDLEQIEDDTSSIDAVTDETLIKESGKLDFLLELLCRLKEEGHRTLIFSQSRKILDMIQRILTNRNWKLLRIDGTISKMEERQRRIGLFQKDVTYTVFLLTTQVGGVGITLTAATRVIVYDPSWNPATDAQAVDRVYRIGQQKNVVVYRLITCGSVEEKIYRRQIFKDSITRQTTGANDDPTRYFSRQELRELFTLDDIHHSATQVQLSRIHSRERVTDTSLDEHIAYLHQLNIFGISDHDLMFTKHVSDEEEDNADGVSDDYIRNRVIMAQKMLESEAAVVEEGMKESGSYVKPYTLTIPSSKKSTRDSPVSGTHDIIDLTKDGFLTPYPKPSRLNNQKSESPSKSPAGDSNDVIILDTPEVQQFPSVFSSATNSGDSTTPESVKYRNGTTKCIMPGSTGEQNVLTYTQSPRVNMDVSSMNKFSSEVVPNCISSDVEKSPMTGHLKKSEQSIQELKLNTVMFDNSLDQYTSLKLDKNRHNTDELEIITNNSALNCDVPHELDKDGLSQSITELRTKNNYSKHGKHLSLHQLSATELRAKEHDLNSNLRKSLPVSSSRNRYVMSKNKSIHVISQQETYFNDEKTSPLKHLSLSVSEDQNAVSRNYSPHSSDIENQHEDIAEKTAAAADAVIDNAENGDQIGDLVRSRHLDDFADFNTGEEYLNCRRSIRRSCVIRPSLVSLSDSDCQTALSNSNSSANVSREIFACDSNVSEEDSYSEDDSKDRSSASCTQSPSVGETPETVHGSVKQPQRRRNVNNSFDYIPSSNEDIDSSHDYDNGENVPDSSKTSVSEHEDLHLDDDELVMGTPQKRPDTYMNITQSCQLDSPKRITPLRVRKVKESPSSMIFAKAVNESIELSLPTETNMEGYYSTTAGASSFNNNVSYSEEDSPVKYVRKTAKFLTSESEDEVAINESTSKASSSTVKRKRIIRVSKKYDGNENSPNVDRSRVRSKRIVTSDSEDQSPVGIKPSTYTKTLPCKKHDDKYGSQSEETINAKHRKAPRPIVQSSDESSNEEQESISTSSDAEDSNMSDNNISSDDEAFVSTSEQKHCSTTTTIAVPAK